MYSRYFFEPNCFEENEEICHTCQLERTPTLRVTVGYHRNRSGENLKVADNVCHCVGVMLVVWLLFLLLYNSSLNSNV